MLRRYRRTLSDEQRAYYRGVVLAEISEATGYTGDELHEMFKHKFGEASVIELAGETYEVRTFSTARGASTTAEMAHYIDAVILWAATALGIAISPPSHDLAACWTTSPSASTASGRPRRRASSCRTDDLPQPRAAANRSRRALRGPVGGLRRRRRHERVGALAAPG